jgi:membrane-associated protein
MLNQILDIFKNLDTHLATFTTENGPWVYVLLFAIIFAETGLVVAPFLPGDSLLFTVGALCARPEMNLHFWFMFATLFGAGVLGDAVNYHIGRYLGPRIFKKEVTAGQRVSWIEKLLNRKHLDKTHAFFEKYGGKAVVLGRFVPIVRTFVPFVAGAGSMTYRTFFVFNLLGAFLWVGVCMGAGFFFGNLPWVKKNFEGVVVGIIFVSLLPIVIEFVLAKRTARREARVAVVAAMPTVEERP